MNNLAYNLVVRLGTLSTVLASLFVCGCALYGASEEEKAERLFLAPGSMGLSLVVPTGWKGTDALWDEHKLRAAAKKGDNEEIIKRLSHGADINAKDGDGWSALTLSVEADHYQTVTLLLERTKFTYKNSVSFQKPNQIVRDEALTVAVQKANRELVQLLLRNGASANAANDHGISILMRAAYVGNATIMRILIEEGADVSAMDSENHSVTYWAQQGSCAECLVLLNEKLKR